ncbi:MAG: hypothetical protein ACOCRX_01680 [Candidatus Woesearchaeota archaeon]
MKNSKLFILIIGLFLVSSSLLFAANRAMCYISPEYFTSERDIVDTINLTEGQTVQLSPDIVDIDETIVDYKFGYPFEEDGYWNIDYDSSGMYISDLFINTTFDIHRYFFIVNVESGNRPPELTVSDIVAEENETIYVNYDAYDPDNDDLDVSFSYPFDENGTWNTQIGDVGFYNSTITISDGIHNVSENFTITIEKKPLPPKLIVNETQFTKEGENFTLDYSIQSDRDYEVSFSGCMEDETKYFDYDSPESCVVSLEVSDEYFDLKRDITIMIENVNRAPVIESSQMSTGNSTYVIREGNEYTAYEGNKVNFRIDAYDPDGDEIETFVKPFGSNFNLSYNDSGIYESQILVTDGTDNTSSDFVLNVLDVNRPPVIEVNETYYTKEGEYFSLDPTVSDPDGDEVDVRYSGWMQESIRYVEFGEVGNHTVTITADDNEDISQKNVTVSVEKTYREPEVRGITVEILN